MQIELHFEAIEPRKLIEAAVQQQKKLLGDRPLSLNLEANTASVRADLSRATDILVQLIDNANLYSPEGTSDHHHGGKYRRFRELQCSGPRAGNRPIRARIDF